MWFIATSNSSVSPNDFIVVYTREEDIQNDTKKYLVEDFTVGENGKDYDKRLDEYEKCPNSHSSYSYLPLPPWIPDNGRFVMMKYIYSDEGQFEKQLLIEFEFHNEDEREEFESAKKQAEEAGSVLIGQYAAFEERNA